MGVWYHEIKGNEYERQGVNSTYSELKNEKSIPVKSKSLSRSRSLHKANSSKNLNIPQGVKSSSRMGIASDSATTGDVSVTFAAPKFTVVISRAIAGAGRSLQSRPPESPHPGWSSGRASMSMKSFGSIWSVFRSHFCSS